MKRTVFLFFAMIVLQKSFAQVDTTLVLTQTGIDSVRSKILAERKYNIPSYQLNKILSSILSSDKETYQKNPNWSRYFAGMNYSFSKRLQIYDSLNIKARLTYNLINYEQYFQNCSGGWTKQYKSRSLFSRLASPLELFQWSRRQQEYFKEHHDSVIVYLTDIYQDQKFIGQNMKEAIVETDAWEMIPLLITEFEKSPEDLRLLTTLLLLMKKGAFKPFEESEIHKTLYGEGTRYSTSMSIDSTSTVPKQIIELASSYYQTKEP